LIVSSFFAYRFSNFESREAKNKAKLKKTSLLIKIFKVDLLAFIVEVRRSQDDIIALNET